MIFLLFWLVSSSDVTISNVVPRVDSSGTIMDIHDGNTLLLKDGYYYYGASYGLCQEPAGDSGCSGASLGSCGFRPDHNVSLYTSNDLSSWTFQGHVFEMGTSAPAPNTILFCPKVLYNAATLNYVLWFNWINGSDFSQSYYAVATSPKPTGPFQLVNPIVKTLAYSDTGDFALFGDDDGKGYIIYTAHIQGYDTTHVMSIEQLSDDYTYTLGADFNSGFFGDSFVEAPTMFKRQGVYYALFGQCCCYCQEGSPPKVYTSTKALGPYTVRTSLGGAMSAQQTNVLPWKSADGMEYLWQGDRWQSALDGIKGHDFSYWEPLTFDSSGNVTGPLVWVDSFAIDVEI